MTGKIIKGIGGFYYVHTPEGEYECHAKGIFRNRKEKPLVGDLVEIEPVQDSEQDCTGSIIRILDRKNRMLRPETANVDQAMVVFAMHSPEPNLGLLDRFLIRMEQEEIPPVIVFNKTDLAGEKEEAPEIYRQAGYRVLEISTTDCPGEAREKLMAVMQGRTTVLSGPSGVGKSSIINLLKENEWMETGELSQKILRGKNTTRHTELVWISDDTYVLDTPGFTSLFVNEVLPEKLMYYFPEFEAYRQNCRFNTCIHIGEKDCAVKDAVDSGDISALRYDSYCQIYQELKELRRY